MKEKILLAIKAKFPAVNFSKKRLDELSAKLEKKTGTDETLIDAKIDEFNEYFPLADIAKQDDKIADLQNKLKNPAILPKKDEIDPADPIVTDDTPAWVKSFVEKQNKIEQALSVLQGEKVQTTIMSKAKELLKDVPESYWTKRVIPDKIESLEDFAKDVQSDFGAFQKDLLDKGLAVLKPPVTGSGISTVPASEAEIDAILDKIKI